MSVEFTCGDPAGLAGYLYDECDAAERAAIEAHLATCARCASEVAGLGATRTALAEWAPPYAALGFRITSTAAEEQAREGAARVLRPARWWQRPLPAWAQVAAALLIFVAGATLGARANRVAPAAPPAQSAAVTAAVTAAPVPAATSVAVTPQDLVKLERQLRAEIQRTRGAAPQGDASPDAATLQRVRTLLAESEERQQRELAMRLTQVVRDMDAQRRSDLVRIERTFGQIEGFTRSELADQRQGINYLLRTSVQQNPR
jgi:hypothetical protein